MVNPFRKNKQYCQILKTESLNSRSCRASLLGGLFEGRLLHARPARCSIVARPQRSCPLPQTFGSEVAERKMTWCHRDRQPPAMSGGAYPGGGNAVGASKKTIIAANPERIRLANGNNSSLRSWRFPTTL